MATNKKKYKIGVALSGGGSRGFAHLAVLKAMNERGIYPEIISGTSAGSLAAAFYADGHSPEQTLAYFKEAKLKGFIETTLPKGGIFKTTRFESFLKKHLKARTFEDLNIPLRIVASDIEEGQSKVFGKGELIPAILASCCYPIVFCPVEFNGHFYVDGGLFSNFPVSAIRDECKVLIGVNVSPLKTVPYNDSMKYVIERMMNFTVGANTLSERGKCDYLIESKSLSGFSTFDIDSADKVFKKGYKLATSYLDTHKEALENDLNESYMNTLKKKVNELLRSEIK